MYFIIWSVWSILIPYLFWILLMLRIFSVGTSWKSQREFQMPELVFQKILYYLLLIWCHLFKQQGIICNSCTPIMIQHYQKSFWWFLQWWILIIVSHTRIFHKFMFLELILFHECIVLSDLLRLMYVLVILFRTIPDIYVVNLYRLFMQDWVK